MSGGFLAPQFSMFDLNEDGRQELITFDRFSGVIGVWQHLDGIRYKWIGDKLVVDGPRIKNGRLIGNLNKEGVRDIFKQGFHVMVLYEGYRVGGGFGFRPLTGEM